MTTLKPLLKPSMDAFDTWILKDLKRMFVSASLSTASRGVKGPRKCQTPNVGRDYALYRGLLLLELRKSSFGGYTTHESWIAPRRV